MNNFYYLLIIIFIILFIFYIYINNINIELFFSEELPATQHRILPLSAPDLGPIKFVDFDDENIELGRYPRDWTDGESSESNLQPTIIKIKRGQQGITGAGGVTGQPGVCEGNIKIDSIDSNALEIKSDNFKIDSDKITFKNKLCFGDDNTACLDRDLITNIKNHTSYKNRMESLEAAVGNGYNSDYWPKSEYDTVDTARIKCEDTDLPTCQGDLDASNALLSAARDSTNTLSTYMTRDRHQALLDAEVDPLLVELGHLKDHCMSPSCNYNNNMPACIAKVEQLETAFNTLDNSICTDPNNCPCGETDEPSCDEKYVTMTEYKAKLQKIADLTDEADTALDERETDYVAIGNASYAHLSTANKNKYCQKTHSYSVDSEEPDNCTFSDLQQTTRDDYCKIGEEGDCIFDNLKSTIQSEYGEIGSANSKYGRIGGACFDTAICDNYFKRSECDWENATDKDDYCKINGYGNDGCNFNNLHQDIQGRYCTKNGDCAYADLPTDEQNLYGQIGTANNLYGQIGTANGEYGEICYPAAPSNDCNNKFVPYSEYETIESQLEECNDSTDLSGINTINSASTDAPLNVYGSSLTFHGQKVMFPDGELCLGRQCITPDDMSEMANWSSTKVQGDQGTCDAQINPVNPP
tara:strand:+ start:555 stop:2474 length:1920 start_codon:yes stop_codon:yes gene_type:complete